jgi:hypothetical protein
VFIIDKQRILAIARESASRSGLVVYADYNRYLRELIRHRKLDPIDAGWCLWDIKRILLDETNSPEDRYFYGKAGNKACFYPLSSDLFAEQENRKQNQLLSD